MLFVLSLISGLSRVFGGIHFPLDILAAISVAMFLSLVVFTLRNKTSYLLNYFVEKSSNNKVN
ncbi:phosphatase PAP2 family protein [Colwellia psychrerythraea]|uniref:Phosphatidic acid phosphatase type 2/haloperoxidase domain-containing protein n=1 Tax=Colwellia psychrerythraea (strain 34H / ATCC BAA-681) TaxID=167879 RepID=Q481Q2_COLP3|nr:hypothetical protein CPS_2501 [Colwellia psychrerythraea 34H]